MCATGYRPHLGGRPPALLASPRVNFRSICWQTQAWDSETQQPRYIKHYRQLETNEQNWCYSDDEVDSCCYSDFGSGWCRSCSEAQGLIFSCSTKKQGDTCRQSHHFNDLTLCTKWLPLEYKWSMPAARNGFNYIERPSGKLFFIERG